jgi:hypothetical protein
MLFISTMIVFNASATEGRRLALSSNSTSNSSRTLSSSMAESGGGPFGTVPELLFEKKLLIPLLQQLFLSP